MVTPHSTPLPGGDVPTPAPVTTPPPKEDTAGRAPVTPSVLPDDLTGLEQTLLRLVGEVPDPELPVVSLGELGVLRGLNILPSGHVEVRLTPTYTGCPAVEAMSADIERVLREHGFREVTVHRVLSPPWSTEAITDEGRRKLAAAGIAPPRRGAELTGSGSSASDGAQTQPGAGQHGRRRAGGGPVFVDLALHCPRCGSTDTTLLSRFSSTACKALRRCESCLEPFDHLKEV